MTSVAPNLPFFPFGPSTGSELPRNPQDGEATSASFERLLGEASLAAGIPMNASFAATGTLGFECKATPSLPVQSRSIHQPDTLAPRSPEARPQAAEFAAIAPTGIRGAHDPRGETSAAVPPRRDSPPLIFGRHHAVSDPQPLTVAAEPPARCSTVAMEDATDRAQRVSSCARASIEHELSSTGANVSVAVELIGEALCVHVHLPACPDEERQRLIDRARAMLDERGLNDAGLVIHTHAFARGKPMSKGEPMHGR